MSIAQLAPVALIAAMTLPLYQQQAQEEVDLVAQDLERRERVVWQAVFDRDIETLDRFLSDDFVYADSEILFAFPKEDVLEYLDDEPDEGVFEIRVRSYVVPNADTQVFHYLLAGASVPFSSDLTLRTSVWVRRGGRWVAVFHQATNYEPLSLGSK